MRLIEIEQRLLALKQPVLQTSDVSACLNVPHAQASNILARLDKAGRFVHLMRGKWATSQNIDPLILPEYLTSPFPSYISLQTALFYHGMISQISPTIYAVSLSRTKQYDTPFGVFSIHHLQSDFFFGFEMVNQIKMATPEKALIDVLYLTPVKSNLFKKLPEIEFSKKFSQKRANQIINKIKSQRIKKIVQERLKDLLTSQ